MRKRLIVFVSSTVHDLLDARTEVGRHLSSQGCLVKLSEDPESDWVVDPAGNAIESCLRNVETSDAVICIVDKRYGGFLKHGVHAGRSPTHAEIVHAHDSAKKPIFTFIRDQALHDYQTLKDNGLDAKTRWVTISEPTARRGWIEFVTYLKDLPRPEETSSKGDRNNWFDPFKTSIELRSLVERRLLDHFGKRYRTPEAVFRLCFVPTDSFALKHYKLLNPNNEPAFSVRAGIEMSEITGQFVFFDAIAPRESFQPFLHNIEGVDAANTLSAEAKHEVLMWCEYENAAGVRFRIEKTVDSLQRVAFWGENMDGSGDWIDCGGDPTSNPS